MADEAVATGQTVRRRAFDATAALHAKCTQSISRRFDGLFQSCVRSVWRRSAHDRWCAARAHTPGIALHKPGLVARTIADGCADSANRNDRDRVFSNDRMSFEARRACLPTSNIVATLGRRASSSPSSATPLWRSCDVIFRVPFQPGIRFHRTVRLRGISAIAIKLNSAAAVGSSLFREINPEPGPLAEVIGPGFSRRKSKSA